MGESQTVAWLLYLKNPLIAFVFFYSNLHSFLEPDVIEAHAKRQNKTDI